MNMCGTLCLYVLCSYVSTKYALAYSPYFALRASAVKAMSSLMMMMIPADIYSRIIFYEALWM